MDLGELYGAEGLGVQVPWYFGYRPPEAAKARINSAESSLRGPALLLLLLTSPEVCRNALGLRLGLPFRCFFLSALPVSESRTERPCELLSS